MVTLEKITDKIALREFLEDLHKYDNHFRYFKKRSIDTIESHLITLGWFLETRLVGYGHLEQDGEKVWLGIAIAPDYQSKGLGAGMMKALISYAFLLNCRSIQLTVDSNNSGAIYLYEKFKMKELESPKEGVRSFFLDLSWTRRHIFFISSLYRNKSRNDLGALCSHAEYWNLPLEFSSNIAFDSNNVDKYINYDAPKLIHNYFPASENGLVINLASSNEDTRIKSLDFCKRNIRLTAETASLKFFSVHMGFCLDPSSDELGSQLKFTNTLTRGKHIDIFIDSARELCAYAKQYNVDVLFENNVLNPFNYQNGINPLLGCDATEIINIISSIDRDNGKLLLDTAHLKVSCQTLGLDLETEVTRLLPHISGIHHSDNDGNEDTNDKIENNYWFLHYMSLLPEHQSYYHVLEVKNCEVLELLKQVEILGYAIR